MDSKKTERHKISANFTHLIEILAESLYNNKEIFIRELIQNAHDSIIRREHFQNSRLPAEKRKILIRTDVQNNTLIFEDFGIGMNRCDILEFLSVIGSSGTDKSRLEWKEQGAVSPDLIGHFGIGMLSAFAVAAKIEIVTKKAGDKPAYLWRSDGTQIFELMAVVKEHTGTRVILYLKKEYSYFAEDTEAIADVVTRYCEFVPIPVYLNDDTAPLNQECAPWNVKNPVSRRVLCEGFARIHFGYQILDAFYFDTSDECGCDIDVKGIIVINSEDNSKAFGCVDLYINNILVCSRTRELLPAWAAFISAAVECPDIAPTASRNEIVENKVTNQLRFVLEKNIMKRLKNLPDSNPDIFEKIVKIHGNSIKELAGSDSEFFRAVCESLVFDTSEGHLPLQHCKNLIDRECIYYLGKDVSMSAQYAQIADANGYFYFWVNDDMDRILLQKFSVSQNYSFVNLIKRCGEELIKVLDESRAEIFSPLCERFDLALNQGRISAVTQIREFLPESLPALIWRENNIDIKLRRHFMENLRDGKTWSTILPEEIGDDRKEYRLILNAFNPTICELLNYNDDSELLYISVFYNALLRAEPVSPVTMLTIRDCMSCLIQNYLKNTASSMAAAEVMQEFVSISALPEPVHSFTGHDWIRLFFILPYDDEYKVLEQAVRNVFECEPYFYEIVIANKNIREGGYLLPSLRKNMQDCDGYIAEITERNANVMMEAGAALIENGCRPFLPLEAYEVKEELCKKDDRYKVKIADLGDKLTIRYRTFLQSSEMSAGQLEEEIEKQIRSALLNHGRLAHEDIIFLEKSKKKRFLSYTFLQKKLGKRFSEEELELLCGRYDTLEELCGTQKDDSGIGQNAFDFIKKELEE